MPKYYLVIKRIYKVKRKYTISDDKLLSFINNMILVMKSSVTDFQIYNIDLDKINSFYDAARSYENKMIDFVNVIELGVRNEEKNKLKSSLIEKFKENLIRISLKYGKDSAEYGKFYVSKIHILNDDELISASRRAYLLLADMQADLLEFGLTPEILAEFNDTANQFEEAKNISIKTASWRVLKTKERIAEANQLYETTRNYAEIGKMIYRNKSEYKYFILPVNTPKGLNIPPELRYNPEKNQVEWDEISEATSYQLQKHNGKKFVEIYSGSEPFYKLNLKGARIYLRCRARNSKGFGQFGNELEIIV